MPAESLAATVNIYVVEGDKPVTLKLVVLLVPMGAPF
jgi:hypothetical protein